MYGCDVIYPPAAPCTPKLYIPVGVLYFEHPLRPIAPADNRTRTISIRTICPRRRNPNSPISAANAIGAAP